MPSELKRSVSVDDNFNVSSLDKQLAIAGSATRTRFIGKHSRDNRLSIFLNQRNSNCPSELLGLVRINRDALHSINERGATVVVGVMARLLCDHGLQFSEHFVYQRETCIYPEAASVTCDEIQLVKGVLGDAVLPDEFHRGFRLRLPAALPPSCILLSPDTSMGPGLTGDSPWGLTYYLYAYLSTQPLHRKSSKVFLSFTRAIPSNPSALVRETAPPAVSVSKSSNRLLVPGSGKPLSLHAALDRSFFYTDEQMAVHLRLENPRAVNFTGIRITLKQTITMRALNHGRQVIKVPLAAYEFKSIDANGKLQRSRQQATSNCTLKDFPFIIDTLRIHLRPGPELQHVAVESRLPRNTIKSLLLCPSFAQTYEMQDNPLKYFAIEYYMNVHVILPWGTNLIAKLPFTVASRGIDESSLAMETTCISTTNDTAIRDNLTTFEVRDSSEDLSQHHHPLENTLERETPTIKTWTPCDFKIVKCDMERALKLLETGRAKLESHDSLLTSTGSAFAQMRRTWVREFADAAKEVSTHLFSLEGLITQIIQTTTTAPQSDKLRQYTSGLAVAFVQCILDRLIPLFMRFLKCHDREDQAGVLEDALNQSLDTCELVLMKFHILASNHNSKEETVDVNLYDLEEVVSGRLRRELDKLTLVIPGLMEWRWFLQELHHFKSVSELSNDTATLSDNNTTTTNSQLASLFQSIHSRLTEAFSDAQIEAKEIFAYAQLFLAEKHKNPALAFKTHYSYFKEALLVYYGNYPELFIPFDQAPGNRQDLKTMRAGLADLRDHLIQAMID
jgi:hypothetical protein